MPIPIQKASSADSLAAISKILLSSFVIGTLYFGRELLLPLALAALLTFMPAPLVTRLQRRIGRVLVLLIFMLLEREDLRNRMIRLIGQGRIAMKWLEECSHACCAGKASSHATDRRK
ncbi:MAG: hypothetical protein WEB53_11000 [Akkermansiaceae bacterium]